MSKHIDHISGTVIVESKSRTFSETSERNGGQIPTFPSLPKKGGKKPQYMQQTLEEKRAEKTLKRGQRSKLRKIKEKYKDQDDEDKAVMMEILQSGKAEKESKKALKKAAAAKANKVKSGPRGTKIPAPAPLLLEAESDAEPDTELDTEHQGPDADTELLAQLTGIPDTTDELLFAVPVVAPYSAIINYKYKVKLTPGASKRGKAAKTALQVFLRDKCGTPRERDLLKAVKEEDIARNFPGKVKLSAPMLHKHRR